MRFVKKRKEEKRRAKKKGRDLKQCRSAQQGEQPSNQSNQVQTSRRYKSKTRGTRKSQPTIYELLKGDWPRLPGLTGPQLNCELALTEKMEMRQSCRGGRAGGRRVVATALDADRWSENETGTVTTTVLRIYPTITKRVSVCLPQHSAAARCFLRPQMFWPQNANKLSSNGMATGQGYFQPPGNQ
jgi:hypothetical protein